MASQAGNVFKASDFFGSDADGVDKFKTVALRALYDQKTEEEVKRMRLENARFRKESEDCAKEVKELKLSMSINIDDRERVLAFKSKRIEELQNKVKDYEAVNASLLQTINSSSELSEAGRNTAASVAILQRGDPLFHAVETCKEQDYKRLWEEKKLHCEQLHRQITDNETLVLEMQAFQKQKHELESEIEALNALVAKVTAEKDEKIHFLERKLVFEHDRLTKEKDSEILAHQNDMEKQLRLQLDITTQRTIEENLRVQLELRYQSSQLEKLVKQLDTLTAENRQSQHEKQLVEQMNTTLSKKIKFYEHLFAKMQQQDQLKTKNNAQQDDSMAFTPSRASPTRRKPPLPSLATSSGNAGMRSAFALSTPSSPPRSPSRARDEEADVESPLRLDTAALDALGDQLNSVGAEFDSHMIKREFTRKEVKAMLQCHQESPRFGGSTTSPSPADIGGNSHPKKSRRNHKMLTKTEYSHASYAPRGARRFREAPLTLDSFLREHATISPRNRADQPRHMGIASHDTSGDLLSKLPAIGGTATSPLPPQRPPPRAEASQALWKTPPVQPTAGSTEVRDEPQHALTARF